MIFVDERERNKDFKVKDIIPGSVFTGQVGDSGFGLFVIKINPIDQKSCAHAVYCFRYSAKGDNARAIWGQDALVINYSEVNKIVIQEAT